MTSVQCPTPPEISASAENLEVWQGVQKALGALPFYFETETIISGLLATDIFTLNANPWCYY